MKRVSESFVSVGMMRETRSAGGGLLFALLHHLCQMVDAFD
jgi:hypothetical protein